MRFAKKTRVQGTLVVTARRKGKISLSLRSCKKSLGSCKSSKTLRLTYSLSAGLRNINFKRTLSSGKRVLLVVQSGGAVLTKQSFMSEAIKPDNPKEGSGDGSGDGSAGDEDPSGSDQTITPGPSSPAAPTDPGAGTGRNCLAYAYDPAVGYELCSHWFTDSTFPYLEGKGVSGGTVRTEAWREGPTWDSVNNTVYLRATLTIQSRTAVNISLTAAVCGDPQFRPCVDAQQVETIALAAGSNSIVRTYKLTPYRAPLKSQIILVDDLGSAIFIGGSAFLGCRGNINICGI